MRIFAVVLVIGMTLFGTDTWGDPFKINGNGTVTDMATGLTWQRWDDNTQRTNYGSAYSYCQELTLAGGGWRLPTVKELRSIVDDRVFGPSIDSEVFPFTNGAYWSATPYSKDGWSAYFVVFSMFLIDGVFHIDGQVGARSRSNALYVRCVR